MQKRIVKKLGLIFILLLIGLTGCTSSGIHIFSPIWFSGEVRESSILHQPISEVEIYSESGEVLGKTDSDGQFRIQVLPTEGEVKLTFQHAYYRTETITRHIVGSSTQTIELSSLYLKPAGTGKIHGQISREIRLETIDPQKFLQSQLVSQSESQIIEGEYNLATWQSKDWLTKKIQGRGEIIYESLNGFYSLRLDSEYEDQVVQELTASGEVDYILPNETVELLGVGSNEELWDQLWNMRMLDLEVTWQHSTGDGVVVAVLDTLYTTQHPDLLPNLLSPLDVNGNTVKNVKLNEHGLHVAGIIGAVADGQGVLGTAPNVSLLPIRIFNQYGASVSSLIKGIDLAIENSAQVINMSVGTPYDRQDLHEAIQRAYQAGIVMVAAAGNDGMSTLKYPAAYPEVIGVGAVGQDGERTDYSHVGPGIELMAPGGDNQIGVLSTGSKVLEEVNEATGEMTSTVLYTHIAKPGTSMATPHVSGIVAQLIAYGVTDPDYIRLILRETARDLETPGYDENTGYGLVDPYAAINRFRNTYIFFGNLSLETGLVELHSPVYQVEVDGEYEILDILTGNGHVIGWVDVNQNLLIDSGDYLGQSEEMEVDEGTVFRRDLELKWIEGEFNAIDIGQLL